MLLFQGTFNVVLIFAKESVLEKKIILLDGKNLKDLNG